MVLGLKGQRSILGLWLWLALTAKQLGFELYQCLLISPVFSILHTAQAKWLNKINTTILYFDSSQ